MLHSRSLLVIYFKYSSVYMSIPNSLTILPPDSFPLVDLEIVILSEVSQRKRNII